MTVAPFVLSEEHAHQLIAGLIKECRQGRGDREGEALKLAALWLIDQEQIKARFLNARKLPGGREGGLRRESRCASASATG
jgi:hypothetical protein